MVPAQSDEIVRLRETLRQAEDALAEGETESLMRLDRDFHGLIARASRNGVLADILSKLHDRSLRVWFVSLNSPGRNRLVHEEHVAICDAIARHDPDAAEAAMRLHIESFRNHLRQDA